MGRRLYLASTSCEFWIVAKLVNGYYGPWAHRKTVRIGSIVACDASLAGDVLGLKLKMAT